MHQSSSKTLTSLISGRMLRLEKSSSRYDYERGQCLYLLFYLWYALFTLILHFTFPWTQPPQWVCDIQHLRFKHDFKKGWLPEFLTLHRQGGHFALEDILKWKLEIPKGGSGPLRTSQESWNACRRPIPLWPGEGRGFHGQSSEAQGIPMWSSLPSRCYHHRGGKVRKETRRKPLL